MTEKSPKNDYCALTHRSKSIGQTQSHIFEFRVIVLRHLDQVRVISHKGQVSKLTQGLPCHLKQKIS